jgi:hypothetical protein
MKPLTSAIIALLVLAHTGCATSATVPKKAHLVIPVPCIDRAIKFLDGTTCDVIDPAHPDYALCKGRVIVHFTCVKAVK